MKPAILPYLCMTFTALAFAAPASAQTPRAILKGHRSGVFSVAFSPDGKVLLSGSRDGAVISWNVADGSERAKNQVLKLDVNALAISPDGRWVAAGGGDQDNTIRLYDVEKKELTPPLDGHSKGVTSLAFSHDSAFLVSASFDHSIKVWDLKTRSTVRSIMKGHVLDGVAKPVNAVAFSPDGKTLASGGNDGFLRLWDAKTGQQKTAFATVVAVDTIAFNPEGTRIAAAGGPGRKIHVWDLESGQEVLTLEGLTSGITCVRYSPDGKRIASTGKDKAVRLWDAKTGQKVSAFEGHEQTVYCLAFSPDGKTLASGSVDRTVRLWDMPSGQ
jgi:WD40 repeat protein